MAETHGESDATTAPAEPNEPFFQSDTADYGAAVVPGRPVTIIQPQVAKNRSLMSYMTWVLAGIAVVVTVIVATILTRPTQSESQTDAGAAAESAPMRSGSVE